jgi:hypothetical protein
MPASNASDISSGGGNPAIWGRGELGRPLRRFERLTIGIESPQRGRCERHALDDIDAANQRRRRRRGPPFPVRIAERRRGVGIELIAIHLKGDEDARQLGIELPAEVRGARAQRRAHPLALRLADFAQPPVLKRRQRGKQHEQDDGSGQLPGNAAHANHSMRKAGANSRALHFLQNDCGEITTSAAARRHTARRHTRDRYNTSLRTEGAA